jgi:hypothetical protein
MPNLTSIAFTSGAQTATGTVSTVDALMAQVSSKWIAGSGVGLTWTTHMSTELNSLASTNAILASADIVNGTALDRYMDVSLALAAITTPATAGLNVSLHIYNLSDAGAFYGDNRFVASAAGPPNVAPCATIPLVSSLATTVQYGQATGIVIPPGTFRLVLANNAGVALAASGNTLKYRTYN